MSAPTRQLRPGWAWVVGLALLGIPRVVAHDLDLVAPGSLVNLVLAVGPPVAWILVVLLARDPKPFVALLVVGIVYGVLLAVAHQLTWTHAWDGHPPGLGDSLDDILPAGAESIVVGSFAFLSSVATGVLVGAVTGLVGWLVDRMWEHRSPGR